MAEVIGFDWGSKRIGVAVGNSMLKTASALSPILSLNQEYVDAKIDVLLKNWKPSVLVVGVPIHMDGSESSSTLKAKNFCQSLRNRHFLDVVEIDERLSSKMAEYRLQEQREFLETGRKSRKISKKHSLDSLAAVIILEDFFSLDNV